MPHKKVVVLLNLSVESCAAVLISPALFAFCDFERLFGRNTTGPAVAVYDDILAKQSLSL